MKLSIIICLLLLALSCSNEKLEYKAELISPKIYHIDRIEGDIAILLSDKMEEKKINILNIKDKMREGDKVEFHKNNIKIEKDLELKESIVNLQKELSEVKIGSNMDI